MVSDGGATPSKSFKMVSDGSGTPSKSFKMVSDGSGTPSKSFKMVPNGSATPSKDFKMVSNRSETSSKKLYGAIDYHYRKHEEHTVRDNNSLIIAMARTGRACGSRLERPEHVAEGSGNGRLKQNGALYIATDLDTPSRASSESPIEVSAGTASCRKDSDVNPTEQITIEGNEEKNRKCGYFGKRCLQ